MSTHRSLLAGASIGALALLATAAPADAKPAAKHRASSASSGSAAEIRALREEVEALKARLDAQENVQAATANVAQDAQAQAVAAATAAQAAQTQAATVPEQVKTAFAAQPKPKAQWFDNTSISGRMYFNFSNISAKSNGFRTGGTGAGNGTNAAGNPNLNGTGFNIKRFYLGVDHKFNDMFAANVTMDVSNVVGQTSNNNFVTPTASIPAQAAGATPASTTNLNNLAVVGRGFYIKKAYLQAKISPALTIRAGAADLPWVPYAEGLYGYRHIENTIIDRTGFGTSADWGIHVLGDLADGVFSYQFSVIDGAGYRNVKVTKSVDFEGRVSASYKGFFAGVGGYTGKRGNDTTSGLVDAAPRTAKRVDGLVGYKTALFTIGGEYFWQKNWNNVTNAALGDKGDGFSAFANVNFAKQWSVFGRYDYLRPSKDAGNTFPDLKDNYFNVGIQWEPVKIVDLALVYKHEKVKNGFFATQNGTIGGVNIPTGTNTGRGSYNEIGLFGQLRF